MPPRAFASQSLLRYPKISIDRGKVIKQCVANSHDAAESFIDRPAPTWKKILHRLCDGGVPFVLRWAANYKPPANINPVAYYIIKAINLLALFLLNIHQIYIQVYGYFFPYSLLPIDEVCDEFSRCFKWSESIIRAFAWHPNHDRCALALSNDCIYIYEGPTRIRGLQHNHQRKITDLAWQTSDKEVLVVATQKSIIIWRISELPGNCAERGSNMVYLAPGVHFIKSRSDIKKESQNNTSVPFFKIIENVLKPPIISIAFDASGDKLYACSPNSSKIAVLNITNLLKLKGTEGCIEYVSRVGQGFTRLRWASDKNRLAVGTTSSFFRVFEPFKWTCSWWPSQEDIVQDLIWSRPEGRMLLIANKSEPTLYALPFLDHPQAGDVGGNKSLTKALDLSSVVGEFGEPIGGRIHSLAWDKEGKRLAISFRDNPESILLYRTVEQPTLEFHHLGVIKSDTGSHPLLMDFHDMFRDGSLLTICWSDGNVQHLPLSYAIVEPSRPINRENLNQTRDPSTSIRSLTSFCNSPGQDNISRHRSILRTPPDENSLG